MTTAMQRAKDALAAAQREVTVLSRLPVNDHAYPMGTVIRHVRADGSTVLSLRSSRGWLHTGIAMGSYSTWDAFIASYLKHAVIFEVALPTEPVFKDGWVKP